MVSRRQGTTLGANAPVRFYKIVALSFLCLTIILLGVIVFMSSKRATITITTQPEPVNASQDIEIGGSAGDGNLGATVSSTVMLFSKTFEPTGTREESGVAMGQVILKNDSTTDQVLIAKTRVQTPEGVLFHLKDRVNVPAKGEVTAEVYADKAGAEYEIGPSTFTIPGLNEAKQKVIYASSTMAMKGGVKKIGILSAEDIDAAKKALLSALETEAKAKLIPAGKSGAISLVEHTIDPNTAKAGDEVSGFTLNVKATVLVLLYDEAKAKELGLKALQKRSVADSEIVEAGTEGPTVTVERYDSVRGVTTVTLFQTGQAVLNPDSAQVQKTMFFGKTKDEVRRYLLSLDHVHGVDVEFHPAWMLTVPHVPDHVQVIVKNVE